LKICQKYNQVNIKLEVTRLLPALLVNWKLGQSLLERVEESEGAQLTRINFDLYTTLVADFHKKAIGRTQFS